MSQRACATLVAALAMTGCGPSEQQKAQWSEERRVDCLDKICDGDTPPPARADESVMKLNGAYFIAPKVYAKGFAGLAFYWPSKTPVTGGDKGRDFPEFGKNYSEVAIQIFLRHHDGKRYGPDRYERLLQAEREGRLISKVTLRPGLEQWRTQETDNTRPDLWYVATDYAQADPSGAVLSCREIDASYATCNAGFILRPGIAGDTRFHAKHAADWPEIYLEVQRVLNLLKKV